MTQQNKYSIFLLLMVSITMAYVWDDLNVRAQINKIQMDIKALELEISSGEHIMEEVKGLQVEYVQKKKILTSYKTSGSELLNEIEKISDLAGRLSLDIKNLEIDPRNTFPAISDESDDEIPLERFSLNFKLSGNFLEVGNFIDIIEESEIKLRLQKCSFGLDSLDPKGVIAKLGYVTYGEAGQ
jgi:hypothetical protein|tara:strand:- start:2214 stop:2765 length:552 start_codon:yes stop_codon:yes gene_type:complete